MILDGKATSETLFSQLRKRIQNLAFTPSLTVVQVGDNPASSLYIKMKGKKLASLGLGFSHHKLSAGCSESELLSVIDTLNSDPSVSGIIVQLPLPDLMNQRAVLDRIAPEKDVDCLSSHNLGRFFAGEGTIVPATPLGVLRLLEANNIPVAGENICVIGRSNLVGKPLGVALTMRDATVTTCHSRTQDLSRFTRTANIVISAIGKASFLTPSFFSEKQIVIDVGTSRGVSGKITGDVEFETVKEIVGAITPVPGGVGPMTIYGLIENLITLAERR